VTSPGVPAAGPPWAAALDPALLRRLLGRRPEVSLPTRRGLDRLAMGERGVPVSVRLARRAGVLEDQPGELLPVVRPASSVPARTPAPGPRASIVRPRPAPQRGVVPAAPPRVKAAPQAVPTSAETARSPVAPRSPGVSRVSRLRVVPAAADRPAPAVADGRDRSAPVDRSGPAAGRSLAGARHGTASGQSGGARTSVDAGPGSGPAAAVRPVRPVRPVRRTLAPAVAVRLPASAARAVAAAARPVVRPRPRPSATGPGAPEPGAPGRPLAAAGPFRTGSPSVRAGGLPGPTGNAGLEPARAGGPPRSMPAARRPTAPPPAAPSPAGPPPGGGGGPVQRLATGATASAAPSPPAVDEVVEQVLRRLGREFAVSAERRGLRGGERPGELGR